MRNKKVVLASRPEGTPKVSDFMLVEEELAAPAEGQVLVQTEHLSIDAFIRTTLDSDPGHHGNIELGTPVVALGVGRVLDSRVDGLSQGDRVFGPLGAQTHVLAPSALFRKLEREDTPARSYLGALGMTTGLTAYAGMLNVGEVAQGDTVVVSAAAGAVGSIACQLARIQGAKVIGLAGGPDKVSYIVDQLGCHAGVDYKAGRVAEDLKELAPDGIDLYFDNVGGELLDVVLDQISQGARVVICGAISQYNDMTSVRGPNLYLRIAERNASMRGFTVDKHADAFEQMEQDIAGWLASGELKMPEQIEQGIESFPEALTMLFSGGHMGKLLVACE